MSKNFALTWQKSFIIHRFQLPKFNAYSIFFGKGIDLHKSTGDISKSKQKGEKQFHFCSLTSSDLSLLPIDVAQSVSPVHGQKNVKLAARPNLHNPTKREPPLFAKNKINKFISWSEAYLLFEIIVLESTKIMCKKGKCQFNDNYSFVKIHF